MLVVRQRDPVQDGTLEVDEVHPNFVEVYFVPPERSLISARLDPTRAENYRVKLLDINGQQRFLTIHPISTFGDRPDFLNPKYDQVKRITLDRTDIIIPGFDWAAPTEPEGVLDVLEALSKKDQDAVNGVATWPALAVNYTTKTQYLFRINKGAFDLSDNSKVNQFVEKRDRPVPFENMVFIGDGSTDIPCFRLVKEQGGLSVAVFKPNTKGARNEANNYFKEGRVHCIAPANYTNGSKLDRIVKANISAIAARTLPGAARGRLLRSHRA